LASEFVSELDLTVSSKKKLCLRYRCCVYSLQRGRCPSKRARMPRCSILSYPLSERCVLAVAAFATRRLDVSQTVL